MVESEQIRINEWVDREEKFIASRIFRIRTGMNIEREDLAMLIGESDAQMAKYESGIDAVPASTLICMSFALGVDIGYFYGEDNLKICNSKIYANEEERPVLLS